MKAGYCEFAPSARLAPFVECFWTHRAHESRTNHRVLPDGCVDILFSRRGAEPGELQVVGTMTRHRVFALHAGQFFFGVRFRPGMWSGFLPVPGQLITDQMVPLQDVWGLAAHCLRRQLAEAGSVQRAVKLLEAHLDHHPSLSPVQRACSWLAKNHGQVPVEELADLAGLSPRQFRRRCLEQTGLTPKRLSRILRFRRALAQARRRGVDWAQFGLDCGYYDQAHFINEFREFSGLTPGEFTAAPAA